MQGHAAEGMSGAVPTMLCTWGCCTSLDVALMRLAFVANGTEGATSAARLRTRTLLPPVGHAVRLALLWSGASSPQKRYVSGATLDYVSEQNFQSRLSQPDESHLSGGIIDSLPYVLRLPQI